MMKVKLILSLDQLEKAYKEYKKAFRFSGLFFGIHQEIKILKNIYIFQVIKLNVMI